MTRPMPLAFSESEYARRLRDLRARMRARFLDALLVVVAENITYLSGYETIGYSNFGVLVVRQDADPFLFIREMERTVAETTTWLRDFETFADDQDPLEQAVAEFEGRVSPLTSNDGVKLTFGT